MRKIGKDRTKKFIKALAEICVKNGGTWDKEGYNAVFETKAGVLKIHASIESIFNIFARFDHPTRAVEIGGRLVDHRLNPYSGKWNFHYRDEKEALSDFESELKQFMLR